ncbi:SDR family oxidoreductase [Arenibaculum sp.]|uniref:SDR family oxidoreductase n=1 Tax=Arenibaculum sp. TaxID=2865862 RepID=UPI002E0F26DA|nr:SDR family oxidoreductase [Arenibaculum sp.]
MRLQNKVAIVTGAGSGFGEGIARRFAAEGARVVLADINEDAGRRVAAEIGDAALFVRADVSRDADVAALAQSAQTAFGGIDILINNAGYTHRNGPMLDVDEETFDRIYAVNVKSIYLGARHVVPCMRTRGGGVILNVASTAGVRPRPGLTWYNGSKGAAIVLTKSMAVELAPEKIRVVALNPVAGETGMLHLFMGEDTPEKRRQFVSTVPLGRLSRPADIANAALFLCSDEAEFLTGVCMEVDGGRCI